MNWLWFGAIAVDSEFALEFAVYAVSAFADIAGCGGTHCVASIAFDITINRVNWLSNSVNLIYLPVSFIVPWATRRIGLRNAVSTIQVLCGARPALTDDCVLSVCSQQRRSFSARGYDMLGPHPRSITTPMEPMR